MNDTVRIRAATPADAEAYERFMSELFAENLDTLCPRIQTPTCEQVRAWMSTHTGETSVVLLAMRDDELLGTLNLSRFARPHLDHSVGLGINVRADMRGRGVGRALLRAGLAWFANARAIERIELEVISTNAAAIHLYEDAGFSLEGRKIGAVKKGTRQFDLCIMGLRKDG